MADAARHYARLWNAEAPRAQEIADYWSDGAPETIALGEICQLPEPEAEFVPPTSAVAIVGMASIMPGASDLETFWSNILNKVDAPALVPTQVEGLSLLPAGESPASPADLLGSRRMDFAKAARRSSPMTPDLSLLPSREKVAAEG